MICRSLTSFGMTKCLMMYSMKKILLFVWFALIAVSKMNAQTPPPGYTPDGKRNDIRAVRAYETMTFPSGGATPTLYSKGYQWSGNAWWDSVNHRLYVYSQGSWRRQLNMGDTSSVIASQTFANTRTLQNATTAGKGTRDTIRTGGIRTTYITSDSSTNADYEIEIFPDLQNMTNTTEAVRLRPMFNWVRDSMAYYNIKAVLQVGDIINNGTTLQRDTADANIDLLDPSNIPYMFVPGNHDYGAGFDPASRDATLYNGYMGVARFSVKSWYGGHYSTGNENYWIKFNAGTKKYMAVGLEFLPRDAVVTWASNVIDSVYNNEPDREVMIVTHAYITAFGERAVDSSTYSGSTYGMSADNDGEELWQRLIKKKRSVKWVFSGHFLIPGQTAQPLTDHIVSVNDYGDLVNQIYIDYQDDSHGGNGYFMRLHFKPSQGIVRVNVWSPYLGQFDTRLTMPNGDSTAFTLNMPTVGIPASAGVGGTLSVGTDFRVVGELKNDRLKKYRIPFIGDDHLLRDTTILFYDYNIPSGTIGHGLNFDQGRTTTLSFSNTMSSALRCQIATSGNGTHSNAGYFYIVPQDSTYILYMGGTQANGATLQLIGKDLNNAAQGGIDMSINYSLNANAPVRMLFINADPSNPERRYIWTRKIAFFNPADSISFNSPAYLFRGMPRATSSTWVLAYDSATGYTNYIRTSDLGISSSTLQRVLNTGGGGAALSETVNLTGGIASTYSFGVQQVNTFTLNTTKTANTTTAIGSDGYTLTGSSKRFSRGGVLKLDSAFAYFGYDTLGRMNRLTMKLDSLVANTHNGRGIQYPANYGSTFTARSLIDRGYADSLKAEANAYTDAQVAPIIPLIPTTGTFVGDGGTTIITIPHGMSGDPSWVNVNAGSTDAAGTFYLTHDATNIYVNYVLSTPSGTDNIIIYWQAKL